MPCRNIFFSPSDFELLENLRMLVNVVHGRQRTGKEGWLGASMDVWAVAVIPHRFAWPFVCSYSRNNFLFKAFHGKGARRVNMKECLELCFTKMSLLGGKLCVEKLDCLLSSSIPLHCLVDMDNWKIVLKCLLHLICLG